MKKDIEIPKVANVFVAAVHEENETYQSTDWNTYLINNQEIPLENVLIVSKGFDEKRLTTTMRHSIKVLPAKSFAKIEFLQDAVLELNNEYSVSFFAEGKLYHKTFSFPKNKIRMQALQEIPLIPKKGILAK